MTPMNTTMDYVAVLSYLHYAYVICYAWLDYVYGYSEQSHLPCGVLSTTQITDLHRYL